MSVVKVGSRSLDPWFDFERFFDWPSPALSRSERTFTPAVDIYEDDHKIVLKADLPEVNEKDVEVRVEDGTLTLKGERKWEHEEKNGNYHRMERAYGAFTRSFGIPEYVDAGKIAARYNKGVLEVTLPKREGKPANARTIKVQS